MVSGGWVGVQTSRMGWPRIDVGGSDPRRTGYSHIGAPLWPSLVRDRPIRSIQLPGHLLT